MIIKQMLLGEQLTKIELLLKILTHKVFLILKINMQKYFYFALILLLKNKRYKVLI